jgi:hypothetical protein
MIHKINSLPVITYTLICKNKRKLKESIFNIKNYNKKPMVLFFYKSSFDNKAPVWNIMKENKH